MLIRLGYDIVEAPAARFLCPMQMGEVPSVARHGGEYPKM
jgi:hypothetical protein